MKRLGVRKRSWPAASMGIVLLATGISLFAAPVANAALGFQGLSAKPSNLAAGANSDVNVHIGFSDPGDQVKDLMVHLPPGLVGNPTATPLCKVAQLNSDDCPGNSQVGNVTAKVNVIVGGVVPTPLTVKGSLYNLVPQPGEPARFGIVLRPVMGLLPKIIQQSAVKLRPDFGLDTVINDFPREASGNEADIQSIDIQLFGKANGNGFMRNPTSCGAKAVTFDATSYSGHAAHGSAPPFTPTDCNALPFSPRLSVELGAKGATSAGSITPMTTVVDQGDGQAGLENATVILPSQVSPTSVILTQCPLSQFQANASSCPPGSIIGRATATSSYLPGEESGPVVIVEPGPGGGLPRLGVDLHGPLTLQLLGLFVAESQGLGNAFLGLPDIPIAHFELRFHGGTGGLIGTSVDLCTDAPVFHADFAGYNGAKRTQDPTAKILGCGGGGGGGGKPHASVKVKRARSKHPRMRFAIHAGAAPLKGAKLRLPKGLRLAKGKAWRRGVKASDDTGRVPRSRLHHSRRSLRIGAAAGGSDSLRVSLRRHALRRTKRLAHKRLRFAVIARDVDGHRTKQHVRLRVH